MTESQNGLGWIEPRRSRSSSLPAMSRDVVVGNAACLLCEGAPCTRPGHSKPLSDKAMPRDAAWQPPLWHCWPEPIQQCSFKASDQYLTRTSGTCFCSPPLLLALSHSYVTFLQSALETILSCKTGHKSPTDASQCQGGKGRRLYLRTERSDRDTQMVDTKTF